MLFAGRWYQCVAEQSSVLLLLLSPPSLHSLQVKSAVHDAAEDVEEETKEHRTGIYTGELLLLLLQVVSNRCVLGNWERTCHCSHPHW